MHLLSAKRSTPEEAGEAIDLDQSPGDIVFLSAADTEIACLAAAQARRPEGAPSLRLANLLQLTHPMSVDLYVERVVAKGSLVILRLLGGRSYWPYGLEQVAGICRARKIPLAVLPGDDSPDAELAGWNTLPAEACHRLWQYGVHGGLDNAQQLLAYAASLLGEHEPWREPAPLLRAGLYWPGLVQPDLGMIRARWQADRPAAALVFYRALVQAGDLDVIDDLIAALQANRLNPLPIFTASLRDGQAGPLVRALLAETQPDVVLNATGFAVSSPAERRGSPLDVADRAVLQLVLAGGGRSAWQEGTRGLSARDLAMNVALPEVDGRDPFPRGRVQDREEVRRADRDEPGGLRAGRRSDPVRRRAGGGLGAPRPHARGGAAGRDHPGQLPQPRWPDRQWRRPRHAGRHGLPARGAASGGLSDRSAAGGRSGADP